MSKEEKKYQQLSIKRYAFEKFHKLYHIRKSTGEVSDKSEMLSILVDNEEKRVVGKR